MRFPPAAAVLALLPACSTVPPKPPPPAPAAPTKPFEIAKLREDLQVTPLEIVFSGVRGQVDAQESIAIRNLGTEAVRVSGLEIGGAQAASFRLVDPPAVPLALPPSKSVSVTVAFVPPAEAAPGVHRAMLHIFQGTNRDEGPPVDLAGLVARGKQGENEPPLQQIVEALGFGTDVGGPALRLGTGADPIGDEVRAPRLRRSKPTPVSLYPVARYSPDEPIPYGYYTARETLTPLAVIAAGQEQTLNPELEADGKTTFDPGDAAFGLYVKSAKHSTYTEDHLNTGAVRHAARIYPLKSRGGGRIPDAYLVAFEEAQNGDYNDYVFVVWNVKPAD